MTTACAPGGIGAPFQTANNLRGVQEILEDVIERPHLVHRLMEYVTESLLTYIPEMRQARARPDSPARSNFGCSGVFGWEFTDYGPTYTSVSDGRLAQRYTGASRGRQGGIR